jgi:carboxyl-terminal processing protease|tara:strand:- start:612 stop:2228 length:1617 start_codon:yes stop_codon:yes gene_type:complete
MLKTKILRLWPLATSAIFGFLLAFLIFMPEAYSKNRSIYKILKDKIVVMQQIISYVDHFYFDIVDMDKIMDGAFHGLMEELDPHSTYIPAKEQENIEELFRGNFQGIGIEFDILHGYITVISPVPDSPSDHVGLQSGDRIIAINGDDAYKITKDKVIKTLRGKKGTPVDVTIQRIGLKDPFDVTIIRDDIPIYSVGAATMIDNETGYILLRRFSATTNKEVKKAIEKLDKLNFKKLIFDLRGNSGGYLEQAAAVSNIFISTRDTLVYTKGKISDANQAFISDPEKGRNDFSLIVLINRGSASASEIVSGAVQDLDRGLIVGETSFGKGLVQRQLPLEGGSAIRITMARYYTPSGRLIQRPYKEGDDLTYYKELYAKDRETKLDSLKQLRPKYKTRQGRTVYGGGGITPDIYIPYKSKLTKETQKLLRNPERPIFNFSSTYATANNLGIKDFNIFKQKWQVSQAVYSQFLDYLDSDSISFNPDSLLKDQSFIYNRIKSEMAGSIWGKDESASIRLSLDNQVSEALKYFNEADAFLGYRN